MMKLPPRLTKRPKDYAAADGDELVRVLTIGPEHRGRIFEARDTDGAGILGPLMDVTTSHLDGQTIVRFKDVRQGLLADFDALLLLKAPGTVVRPAP